MKWTFFCVFLLLLGYISPIFCQTVIPVDFLYSFGEPGDSLGQFFRPQAISIDPTGNIYIADTGNHRVQYFDHKGNFVAYLGGIGTGNEQFDTPSDVCASDGLNVFVVDQNNHRVHHLDRRLHAIAIFSGSSIRDNDYQFTFPKSIVVSSQGDQFIVETERNSVLKFNSFYTPIARFGAIETGEGILNQPEKIEKIGNEFICVADGQASRIAVFDYFGNFIQYLGEGKFQSPSNVFFWSEKNLLVISDLMDQMIYAVNFSGDFFQFKPIQTTPSSMWRSPVDFVIWQNKLVVLDQDKHQVLVYRIGAFPN